MSGKKETKMIGELVHIFTLSKGESPDLDNEEFGSPPPEFLDPNANLANDNDAYRSLETLRAESR